MKNRWIRFLALGCVLILMLSLTSCGGGELTMDKYKYDGYLNAQWGMEPEQVWKCLGLTKKQLDKKESTKLTEYPESTFGYNITRKTTMYGVPVQTETVFATNLYGLEQYTGFYTLKITFIEEPSDTAILSQVVGEPYKLEGQKAIDEISKRAMYNTVTTADVVEDERGSWQHYRWACKSTLRTLEDAPTEKVEATLKKLAETMGQPAADALADSPMSTIDLYYDNDKDNYSYIVYSGIPAAILYNLL